MEVTARTVRVYGSVDQYGPAPRMDPLAGDPLALDNFPSEGGRSLVWLGAVPDWLREARRIRRALGSAMLETMFGGPGEGSFEEQFRASEADPEVSFKKENWYVTLAVERLVEAPEADDSPRHEYVWLDPAAVREISSQLKEEFTPVFDLIAVYISPVLQPGFFSNVVVDGHVCFMRDGRRTFSVPELSGTLDVSAGRSTVPLDALRERLSRLGESARGSHGWVERAGHWYLSAIKTKDPWNRFEWTWVALEVLTKKLASRFYNEFLEKLRADVASEQTIVAGPLRRVVWLKERMPIAAKFAVAAVMLSPETAETDVDTFASIKEVRDGVVHGKITDPHALPTAQADDLLRRYVALATEFHLQ